MDAEQVERAHKDFPEAQRKEFEENETLKGLLTSTEEKSVTVKIGTVDVKIRSSLPRALRRKLLDHQRICQKTSDDVNEEGLDKVEENLYSLLSELVISPAELKNPMVWKYLDDQDGLATTAFTLIMSAINDQGEAINKFRKK